ncbi:helix-turn-helix domain-containing protein [Candidatus Enterococcus ikei]|uniref:Helix-turn-helix transcriptional regulator n=1 Tax=Candidatus Enterococcus ikei TaxID=2815326 RepID=A0ABS3GVR0_9ENTE|nr:helix-turn-helix transcriptional regulator [Enterococcus sp. DIV0869a]
MKQNILGPIIKEFRKKRHLTQKDVSKLTGFSQNTISNHENGNRSLDEDAIYKYAKAFDVSPGIFFKSLVAKANSIPVIKPDQLNIDNTINIMRKLESDRKDKVYSFAKEQLEEQNKIIELSRVTDTGTLAAHSADPDKIFDEDEIDKINAYLDELDEEYDSKHKK